jgi:hypothetical protein
LFPRLVLFIAAVFSVVGSAADLRTHILALPRPYPGEAKLPRHSLGPAEGIEVWNYFGGGPANANRIFFEWDPQSGRYRRRGSHAENLFEHSTGTASACMLLIQQALPRRTDATAFSSMLRDDYFPKGEGALDYYWEDIHRHNLDQIVDLKSFSWLAASKILELFGPKPPWSHLSEVEGPLGWSRDQMQAALERGDDRVRAKLIRSTLRLYSGFGGASDGNRARPAIYPLPWFHFSTEPEKVEDARSRYIAQYEFSRATNITVERDVLKLISIATAIAQQKSHSFYMNSPYGEEGVGVFAVALEPNRARLFARDLAGKIYSTGLDEGSIIQTTLANLSERYPLSEVLVGNHALANYFPEMPQFYRVDLASHFLYAYRCPYQLQIRPQGSGFISWSSHLPLWAYNFATLDKVFGRRTAQMSESFEKDPSALLKIFQTYAQVPYTHSFYEQPLRYLEPLAREGSWEFMGLVENGENRSDYFFWVAASIRKMSLGVGKEAKTLTFTLRKREHGVRDQLLAFGFKAPVDRDWYESWEISFDEFTAILDPQLAKIPDWKERIGVVDNGWRLYRENYELPILF